MLNVKSFNFYRVLLAVCLGLLWSVNTYAAQNKSISTVKDSMFVIGKAQFTVLFWDIYSSTLLSSSTDFSSNAETYVFEINYQKDIDAKQLVERTVEQWQYLKLDKAVYESYQEMLYSLWPDIKSGETLALLVEAEQSTFFHNDQFIGSINDANFGKIFTDIWLSPNTSQPRLREDLLGIKNE